MKLISQFDVKIPVVCVTIFFLPFFVNAQVFTKAPKSNKAIKSVIEWIRLDEKAETLKGFVHRFDKKGNYLSYENADSGDKGTFVYDDKNRLIEKKEGVAGNHVKTNIIYKNDQTIKESFKSNIAFNRDFKTVEYFDEKRKKIEEKVFVKGDKIGEEYILMQRTVYNYNAQDSLFGEMEYQYIDNNWKKMKIQKRKTIHYYDEETNKRNKTVYYNFDDSVRTRSEFKYTEDGQYKNIYHTNVADGTTKIIDYIYKDGKLWQEKMNIGNYKSYIDIYKDGLKVRSRSYLGKKIVEITDYQYIYF